MIAVEAKSSETTLFSPLGPLTHDELELIDVQGNTLLLARLLPGKEVAIGAKWAHDDAFAASLLNLDAIVENKLESTLNRVDDRVAIIEMSGFVEGSVGGVTTRIEVTAKYNFDLDASYISWLAMSLKEDRAVGHAEPGLNVTARLRVSIGNVDASAELSDTALADLPLIPDQGNTLLALTSDPSGFRFLHHRNWKVMVDRTDVMILRLVERGELIAQCNISRLPDALPEKQLSLSSFQADVRRVLDQNFGQFADMNESKTDRGLRMLRVVVAGIAADLPIQWNYYHVTDEQGRQASLVFTMDAKLVERFGGADQMVVSTLEFLAAKAGASTTKATGTAGTKPTISR
jgi:hypothetical protein